MGKSAPSTPVPDPTATANAQSSANVDTAIAQQALNDTNQVTPFGTLTFEQTGTRTLPSTTTIPVLGPDGRPIFGPDGQPLMEPGPGQQIPLTTATTTLNPTLQSTLSNNEQLALALSGLGNSEEGQVASALSQPFNTAAIPPLPTNPSGIDQGAENTVFNSEMSLLKPQFDQQNQLLEDQLAHQGIEPGNVAATTEEGNLQRSQGVTEQQAAGNAVTQGMGLGAQEFSQQTAANEAAVQEQQFLRDQPLNEAMALMSGTQVNQPSFSATPQTAVAPTDVVGAQSLASGIQSANTQGQIATNNSNTTAAAGAVAAAAMAAAAMF